MNSDCYDLMVIVCTGGSWREDGQQTQYARRYVKNHVVEFASDTNFRAFFEMVLESIQMQERRKLRLTFRHPTLHYVADIGNEKEMGVLKRVIQKSTEVVYVYVVDYSFVEGEDDTMVDYTEHNKKSEEGSGIGRKRNMRIGNTSQEEQHALRVNKSSGGKCADEYVGQTHGHTVEQTVIENFAVEAHGNAEHYNYSGYYVNEAHENQQLQVVGLGFGPQDWGYNQENAEYQDHLCMGISDIEGNESQNSGNASDSLDDEEGYPKELLYGMPSPPPCPGPIHNSVPSHSRHPEDEIKEEQTFKDKKSLRTALGLKSLKERFEYTVERSDKKRFKAVCKDKKCGWYLTAAVIDGEKLHHVQKFNDKHTCSKTTLIANHKGANKHVMGHLISQMIGVDHSRIFRGHDIVSEVAARFHANITYKQAWVGKEEAFNIVRGPAKESFRHIPAYCYNLRKHNPGTVTFIKTDNEDCFVFVFIAIGSMIDSFRRWCRKTLVLDAAHLKGAFKGTMYLAVAMDANNQILPVAYAIGFNESTVTWSMFLEQLHKCVGDVEGLTFVTDRAESIATSIASVFPQAVHGICGYHLLTNILAKHKGKGSNHRKATKAMFWKVAKAYNEREFNCTLLEFQRARKEEWEYLRTVDPRRWSRAFFEGRTYNIMTSNSAESINALTVHARKMPVLVLLDYLRHTIQSWLYTRRQGAADLETPLSKWAEDKLVKRKDKVNPNWKVYGVDGYRYQVAGVGSNEVVDFRRWTCTCRKWEKSGMPCPHAIHALQDARCSELSAWTIPELSTQFYRNTYGVVVNPSPPSAQWERPDGLPIVNPPVMNRRQPGRPKENNRIPSQGEDPIVRHCTRCGQLGHNNRDCPNPKGKGKVDISSEQDRWGMQGQGWGTIGPCSGSNTRSVFEAYSPYDLGAL